MSTGDASVQRSGSVLENLLASWERDAARADQIGDLRGAQMLRRLATEARDAIASMADDVLTLEQAARESGYSADHIGRLVRTGRLRNVGRPHAPRVLRGELPRKPATLLSCDDDATLPAPKRQVARALLNSQDRRVI